MRRLRLLTVLLIIVLVAPLTLRSANAQKEVRIKYVVNGVLGDKSFFDSAQRGVDQIVKDYGATAKTVELGIDPQNWETGLNDAMADKDSYDIMIAGTFQMNEYLAKRAHQYPDKIFFFFDAPMPYDDKKICQDGCKNVYSITYAQNQGSFLAGVYAAAITQSNLEGVNPDPIIGAVGGQDIPVINDFVVGYEQGACLVNPKSQFLVQYAGGWNDPAKGKEIALAMYQQKADIVFQIAGGTGVGVFEAAKEQKKYAIGVDSDQATIILDTDPDAAARILTSMQKNVDNSLVRAMKLWKDGKLPLGKEELLGVAEGGVSLSVNDIYKKNTPQEIQDLIKGVEEAVTKGDLKVISFMGDNPAKVTKDCTGMPEMKFDVSKFLKK
ncbi:MAG: BMP family ABC transporter substrate-binding protein [Anaerolineae bacterium]|nr:BMP family ABC transporter substrate-binding protein [Anaerolineae bacterium]